VCFDFDDFFDLEIENIIYNTTGDKKGDTAEIYYGIC